MKDVKKEDSEEIKKYEEKLKRFLARYNEMEEKIKSYEKSETIDEKELKKMIDRKNYWLSKVKRMENVINQKSNNGIINHKMSTE